MTTVGIWGYCTGSANGAVPVPGVPVPSSPESVEASINAGLSPEPTVPAGISRSDAAPPSVADSTVSVPASWSFSVTVLLALSTLTISAAKALPCEKTTLALPRSSPPTYTATVSFIDALSPSTRTSAMINAGMRGYLTGVPNGSAWPSGTTASHNTSTPTAQRHLAAARR